MSIYKYKRIHSPGLTDKEIKRIYVKRRHFLKSGHCVRCCQKLTETRKDCEWFPEQKGELIAKGGIMKDGKCPRCETDLIEFCFQDLLDDANNIIDKAKEKSKDIIEKANLQAKEIKKIQKKTKKKSSKKSQNEVQDCMFK